MWHYTCKGEKLGPVSHQEMQALIASKTITDAEYVWREGFEKWQPLAKHFKKELILHQYGDAHVKWLITSMVLAIAARQLVVAVSASDALVLTATILTTLYLLVTTIVLGFKFLKKGRYQRAHDKNGMAWLYRISGVVCILGVIVPISISQIVGSVLINQTILLSSLKNYKFEIDAEANTVSLKGTVGPDLSEKLAAALKDHPNINKFIIDSPGGLLNEAIKTSKLVAENGLAVHVKDTCESACAIILLAAEKRVAEFDMEIGFHAATTWMGSIKLENIPLTKEHQIAAKLLELRNVPQDVLNHNFDGADAEMYRVPAIRLIETGSLTGLTRDGEEISKFDALYQLLVREFVKRYKRKKSAAHWYLLAVEKDNPTDLDYHHARQAYNALRNDDYQDFLQEIIPLSFVHQGDEFVIGSYHLYTEAVLGIARALEQQERWEECKRFVNQLPTTDLTDVPIPVLEKYIAASKWLMGGVDGTTKIARGKVPYEHAPQDFLEDINYFKRVKVGHVNTENPDKASCLTAQYAYREILKTEGTFNMTQRFIFAQRQGF